MTNKGYILLGPPGSGKSTQAEILSRELSLVHIDIGAELRAAAEEDTPFAQEINKVIHQKKELVSDVIVYGVLSQALMRVPLERGVLIDGAPRRKSQIDEVLHVLRISGREFGKAVFLRVSEEESVRRISKRFKCFACGRPLILGKDIHSPSEACPVCGGRIGQRQDDTPEGVRKRYSIFHEDTLPVIEYFRERNLLLEVDGEAPSEGTAAKIVAVLKSTA